MAKTSAIQKNIRRIKLVKKYAKKRALPGENWRYWEKGSQWFDNTVFFPAKSGVWKKVPVLFKKYRYFFSRDKN